VEGAADVEGEGAFGAGGDGGFSGLGDGFDFAADDELTGAIVIGDDDDARRGFADFLKGVSVEAQDGGHGSGVLLSGLCHDLASGLDEARAFFDAEDSGGGEGGVFADAVTGDAIDSDFALQVGGEAGPGGDAAGVERELGVLRLAERFLVGLEAELSGVDAGGLGDGLEYLAGLRSKVVKLFTHARLLGTLAGENDGDHIAPL